MNADNTGCIIVSHHRYYNIILKHIQKESKTSLKDLSEAYYGNKKISKIDKTLLKQNIEKEFHIECKQYKINGKNLLGFDKLKFTIFFNL